MYKEVCTLINNYLLKDNKSIIFEVILRNFENT